LFKSTGGLLVVLAAVGGCASAPSAPRASNAVTPASPTTSGSGLPNDPSYLTENSIDRVIARVSLGGGPSRNITMAQLIKPLIEARGLDTLLLLVQLDLAKQHAEDLRVVVSPEEIKAEREATLGKLYEQSDRDNDELIEKAQKANKPDEVQRLQNKRELDRTDLLARFLEQQRISNAELELILETNAYLRKMAEPEVASRITEKMLQDRFKARFNERVKVRHIELNRMQDAAEAKRRLAAGEPFVQVVREMSKNRTSQVLDGELPPFSQGDDRLPQTFRDAAFLLEKKGEISQIVSTGETFQIIMLEERIMPKGVKFEDVRDLLRRELLEEMVQRAMGLFRQKIGAGIRQSLQIDDPELDRQFKAKTEAVNRQVDRDRILETERQEAERNKPGRGKNEPNEPAPVFGPSTLPMTRPVTRPAAAPRAPAAIPTAAPAAATRPAGASTRPAGNPK
jgi:parvulin-like peptidyl-prolyl isomerase